MFLSFFHSFTTVEPLYEYFERISLSYIQYTACKRVISITEVVFPTLTRFHTLVAVYSRLAAYTHESPKQNNQVHVKH